MSKLNVVFCGNPEITISCLQLLNDSEIVNLSAVITNEDKPAGRGKKMTPPPVAAFAKDNNLKLFQTENINKDECVLDFLNNNQPDLIIVYAFSQFLSAKILNSPKLGCFNIHGSLLPKYRGAAPIQYALLNNDKETGICLQRMVKKMDAGDVAEKISIPIHEDMDSIALFGALRDKAVDLLETFVNKVYSGKEIQYEVQNESEATYAPIIQKSDGQINFSEDDFLRINCKLRAFSTWPGVYFFINNKRIKVLSITEGFKLLKPNQLDTTSGKLLIGCKDGSIELEQIKPEGKKAMSGEEFINGNKNQELNVTEN